MIYLDDARRGMEYLVHKDLRRIRDCLDLLIPQIVYPDAILGQSGEFAFSDGEDFEKVREYLASV